MDVLRRAEIHSSKQRARRLNLSETEQVALQLIADSAEPVPQAAITPALGVTFASVTMLVDRLERRGLVHRTNLPPLFAIHATPEGSVLADRARELTPELEQVIHRLPPENAQIVAGFLEQWCNALQSSPDHPPL